MIEHRLPHDEEPNPNVVVTGGYPYKEGPHVTGLPSSSTVEIIDPGEESAIREQLENGTHVNRVPVGTVDAVRQNHLFSGGSRESGGQSTLPGPLPADVRLGNARLPGIKARLHSGSGSTESSQQGT